MKILKKESHIQEIKTQIIYYAHPMETHITYLEHIMEESVKKLFGRVHHINEWSKLKKFVGENSHRKLKEFKTQMNELANMYRKIPEDDAKKLGHNIMEILKSNMRANQSILLSPSTFSEVFSYFPPKRGRAIIDEFKRKAFPSFCYGLIDHCDIMVAHGYILDDYTRRILKSWLELPWYFRREEREYSNGIIQLVETETNLLSPGVCCEIKYALNKEMKVYFFQNEELEEITREDFNMLKAISFDGYYSYNKIWQPIARHTYQCLTELYYRN